MKSPVFDESVVENPGGSLFDMHALWEGVGIDVENADTCDYEERSLENTLVRLSGIDAFEVRGMNISYLRKSKFLYRLNFELRQYLEPKLTEQSIRIHKDLGFKASYLQSQTGPGRILYSLLHLSECSLTCRRW